MLPPKHFNICHYEWMNADEYGKICRDGKHFYSTAPENAKCKVLVGIRAHTVDILTDGGQILTNHRRMFGEGRTNISDYRTTLAVLMKNSGAWHESGLLRETLDVLHAYICELFYVCCDDIQDIELCTAPSSLVAIFMGGLRTGAVKITNAIKPHLINWFVSQPAFIKNLYPQSGWEVRVIYDNIFLLFY